MFWPMPPLYVHADSVAGPNFDWIWYCIPKNASRSLLRVLVNVGGVRLGKDARDRITQQTPKLSFAFVRHPEARVISAWRNKVLNPPPTTVKLMKGSPGLRAGMALNDFVEWLAEATQRKKINEHWRPQSDFVCGGDGKVVANFVGKVERLEADFEQVRAQVGTLDPIPRLNAIPSQADEVLTARSRDILRDIYRKDFDAFGYD
jgi:chondroitin 4-sulfotransferase 11